MRVLFALALFASLAAPASAQRSTTGGLFLHLSADGQALYFDEDDLGETDGGGGLALRAGYGVSRVVTLYAGVSGARVDGETNRVINDTYDWTAGELGVRLHLLPSARLVPYLDVALRGVAATYDEADLEFRGGGAALGAGLAVYVSPAVALDVALRVGGGGFDEVQLGRLSADVDADDFGYGEGRLSIGLTAFPLR